MYALLKIIVRLALRVFYKKVQVKMTVPLSSDGPLIVVANHPNTFMDPILIASILKQEVYFLTNGSVFKSPVVGWLLAKMNMIPIYRQQDTDGKMPDNRESFAKCFEFLEKKGTLLIFPEGSSVNERRLRKIKTGTARIALGAEAENNFGLNLRILTIGLNYSAPQRFRTEVFVNIEEPIQVATFAESYQEDPFKAVHELSELMREKLEKQLIITKTDEEDKLVHQIEILYKNKLLDELNLNGQVKEQEFALTQGIVEAIHYFEENDPERMKTIHQKTNSYFNKLQSLQLNDQQLDIKISGSNGPLANIVALLYAIVGFPLYVYGLINNYIPYIIPSKIAPLISKDEVYTAPIMMTTGIGSFSLFYGVTVYLFYQFVSHTVGLTVLYAISLPISGFFVLHYWNHLIASYHNWAWLSLFRRKSTLAIHLVQKRQEIIGILEQAKKEYLSLTSVANGS